MVNLASAALLEKHEASPIADVERTRAWAWKLPLELRDDSLTTLRIWTWHFGVRN